MSCAPRASTTSTTRTSTARIAPRSPTGPGPTDGRAMSDTLLVLNAGSSSLKFSVFFDEDPPRPMLRGALDGLEGRPRFIARAGDGQDRQDRQDRIVGNKEWPVGTRLGHDEAVEFLFAWGRTGVLGDHRVS